MTTSGLDLMQISNSGGGITDFLPLRFSLCFSKFSVVSFTISGETSVSPESGSTVSVGLLVLGVLSSCSLTPFVLEWFLVLSAFSEFFSSSSECSVVSWASAARCAKGPGYSPASTVTSFSIYPFSLQSAVAGATRAFTLEFSGVSVLSLVTIPTIVASSAVAVSSLSYNL